MFGVTYVLARDGYSGKIVGSSIMSYKNNRIIYIYQEVYRQAILTYGLFDELRVDHGREFYLILFIQEKLRETRGNPDVVPYRQTPSTQNHIIERIWVEVNQRVSYPLKRILIRMTETNLLNMQCDMSKHCIHKFIMEVAKVGLSRFIDSWNAHRIPNHGIPNDLQIQCNGTTSIHPQEIPLGDDAVQQYRQQGGHLTDPHPFGSDPLEGNEHLQGQRDRTFIRLIPEGLDYGEIFSQIMSGHTGLFENAITTYITITQQLSP